MARRANADVISKHHVDLANELLAAGTRRGWREAMGPLGGGSIFAAIGLFAAASNDATYSLQLLVAGIVLIAAGPAMLVAWGSR